MTLNKRMEIAEMAREHDERKDLVKTLRETVREKDELMSVYTICQPDCSIQEHVLLMSERRQIRLERGLAAHCQDLLCEACLTK